MNELIEKMARVIADHTAQPYDRSFRDKNEWMEHQGRLGHENVDINAPFKDDYDAAAQAALNALREHLLSDEAVERAIRAEIDLEIRKPTLSDRMRAALNAALGGAPDMLED